MPALKEIFDRGVISEVIPSRKAFEEAAKSRKLRFYIGFDATGEALHLGHAQNLILLEEFRSLGHEVIVLFGDFTARIGDPTDKDSARAQLSKEEVDKNVKLWLKQIKPLLNFQDKHNPVRIMYNSKWLANLNFEEILSLATNFTVQQMTERDMFQKRLKNDKPIYLHEFLYPLMQGYDSVVMDVDVELAGTDQTFNALAGRILQKRLNNKEKFVITTNLIADPESGKLMSKSQGTGVFLNVSPSELFRNIMALPDSMTEVLLTRLTRIPLRNVANIVSGDPLEAKERTAFEITKLIHGENKAESAKEDFQRQVRSKNLQDSDFEKINYKQGQFLWEVLVQNKIVPSRNQFNRLVEAGAVKLFDTGESVNDKNIKAWNIKLKIGKKRYARLTQQG
ncbi:tyrosine--tRNA ligase [Candidatus Saccharibacteria bacterium CPR2]|nr:tyrosine--tRNA ligase [Candidatus Saccharibacteria bacterium CPR2]